MKRYALKMLEKWKDKPNRKPLLLQGARQVGKTWLLKEFGRTCFKNMAYVSFYDNSEAKAIFESTYNLANIISALEIVCGTRIVPGKTLIVLDEIQECERAVNALKFFNENAKQYHIAVAGSLLGVALNHQKMSFPVGQIDLLTLYPLSFCEFLDAVGQGLMAQNIFQRNAPVINTLTESYTNLLRQYMFIGGMPEAVQTFIDTNNYESVREVQNAILVGYENDFVKYTDPVNVARIRAVWNSVPAQLAKENKKFVYTDVKTGARSREYQEALEWLKMSGLVHIIHNISKPDLPMAGYEEANAFKVYMMDSGLLCAKSGLSLSTILDGHRLFEEFKGALTEQYVLQELVQMQNISIAYWKSQAQAEIDFVIQFQEQVVPIEVKATYSIQAKSMQWYRKKYQPAMAVRTSLRPYESNDGLYNVPLYMVEALLGIIA